MKTFSRPTPSAQLTTKSQCNQRLNTDSFLIKQTYFYQGTAGEYKKIIFNWSLMQVLKKYALIFVRSEPWGKLCHFVALNHSFAVRRSNPESNSIAPRNFFRSELTGRPASHPLPWPCTLPITANSNEKGDWVRSWDAVEDIPNIEYGWTLLAAPLLHVHA